MKKTVFLIQVISLLFLSCRKFQKQAAIDHWIAYRKAYTFLGTNKDSAFLHFNRLAENSNDREQVVLAYYNMALIQSDAADYFGAQESLIMSLKSLDEKRSEDRNYLAINFNELSMVCFNLREYSASLTYAEKALNYANDKKILPYIWNSRGNAYQKLKRYDEAAANYQHVLNISDKNGTVYARALTNLANTKWLKNSLYNPVPKLKIALLIRIRQKDIWGENSSYAHLADFYLKRKPDSALFYAKKMLTVARNLKSPDDELEAIQKLIPLSGANLVKMYFMRYQTLTDSLGAVRKAAKNQFALIRYDVEKNKAENLALQEANTKKNYQLGGVIIAMLTGTVILIAWYRKRKQRLQLEADNCIRKDRLRLSQKVHDVVANGIYRVMNEVQYGVAIDKEDLIDQLDMMYEQSRDISYEDKQEITINFNQRINRLLGAFKSKAIKLAVTGNDKNLWGNVSDKIKAEIEPALQELMVNMTKHSKATQALISFEIKADHIIINYRDNGVGLPDDVSLGNGLRNTENRMKSIGGMLTFDRAAGQGARIQLSVPFIK